MCQTRPVTAIMLLLNLFKTGVVEVLNGLPPPVLSVMLARRASHARHCTCTTCPIMLDESFMIWTRVSHEERNALGENGVHAVGHPCQPTTCLFGKATRAITFRNCIWFTVQTPRCSLAPHAAETIFSMAFGQLATPDPHSLGEGWSQNPVHQTKRSLALRPISIHFSWNISLPVRWYPDRAILLQPLPWEQLWT